MLPTLCLVGEAAVGPRQGLTYAHVVIGRLSEIQPAESSEQQAPSPVLPSYRRIAAVGDASPSSERAASAAEADAAARGLFLPSVRACVDGGPARSFVPVLRSHTCSSRKLRGLCHQRVL